MKKYCCQEKPAVTIQPSPDNQTVILVVPKEQAYAVLHAQEAFFALYHLVNQSEIRSVRKYTTADEKFKTPQDAIEWAYPNAAQCSSQTGFSLAGGEARRC